MDDSVSTMTRIWPAKAEAGARRGRIARIMAPFETLPPHPVVGALGRDELRRADAAHETGAGDMKGWTSQA